MTHPFYFDGRFAVSATGSLPRSAALPPVGRIGGRVMRGPRHDRSATAGGPIEGWLESGDPKRSGL